MMTTITETNPNLISQSLDLNNYAINPSYTQLSYDYHSNNLWEKSNYSTFHHQSSLLSSTGGIPSFNIIPNLNNTNPNFYRHHPQSTSIYSSNQFNYSPQSSQLFFEWNNRSYQDYSQSSPYSLTLPTSNQSNGMPQTITNNSYGSFYNLISTTNVENINRTNGETTSNSLPSKSDKRPRLTDRIRREILKLKSMKSTVLIWEIEQKLLENGICTSQTLPSATVIRRVLRESLKTDKKLKSSTVKSESTPVTVSLSPTLSNGDSTSECSICLETYCSGQEISILSCSHEYHSSCIDEWMLKSRTCPMCRKDIHNQPQFVTILI